MPMVISHNLGALTAQRWADTNNANMATSLERLSSGYRINSGKDDPAGLVISEQLRAQNEGIKRGIQNAQEAYNMLGIAEGSLVEMNTMLRRVRQLALHALNNTTNDEQITADQAELDRVIMTIDRVARTSRYSFDGFLLNGGKQLGYNAEVQVSDFQDTGLLDHGLSDISQIFKRKDNKLNVNFSGAALDAKGNVTGSGKEARKGFFEITKDGSAATQLNTGFTGDAKGKNYTLTKDQAFTVTGNLGNRYFSFAKGTHLGEMATTINSVRASTGVRASLIFDNDSTTVNLGTNTVQSLAATAAHTSGAADAFNRTALGEITTNGVSRISVTGTNDLFTAGKGLDGYGRAYLKMIDDDTFALYKDASMNVEVAHGDLSANTSGGYTATVISSNGADVAGVGLEFTRGLEAGMTSTLQMGFFQEDVGTEADTVDLSGLEASATIGTNSSYFQMSGSYFSGVKLGVNTSDSGKLYFKASLNSAGASHVYAYRDSRMRDEDLVAQSGDAALGTTGGAVRLYAVETSGGGTSGLYATLNFGGITQDQEIAGAVAEFTNLGLRIAAEEYGSNQYVKVEAQEGAVWSYYDKTDGAQLMDAGLSGTAHTEYGTDAQITLNGQALRLNGISGDIATLDVKADLMFRSGDLGSTTIAAVGYETGSFGAKAGTLNEANLGENDLAYVTHALHDTTETLGGWTGGMQMQLGEGSGDQERTVYSLPDMTVLNLGRQRFYDAWDAGSEVKSYRQLSLNDLLSGGLGCLRTDPEKALRIIDKSIDDVSTTRASIGAYQSNTLKTTVNVLSIEFENISKTESYIRDQDMAQGTTEFTRNQIMLQASTSMLAQANQQQQMILTLLQ